MPDMSPEEQAFRSLPPGQEKNKAFQEWRKATAQTPTEEPAVVEDEPKPTAKKAARKAKRK